MSSAVPAGASIDPDALIALATLLDAGLLDHAVTASSTPPSSGLPDISALHSAIGHAVELSGFLRASARRLEERSSYGIREPNSIAECLAFHSHPDFGVNKGTRSTSALSLGPSSHASTNVAPAIAHHATALQPIEVRQNASLKPLLYRAIGMLRNTPPPDAHHAPIQQWIDSLYEAYRNLTSANLLNEVDMSGASRVAFAEPLNRLLGHPNSYCPGICAPSIQWTTPKSRNQAGITDWLCMVNELCKAVLEWKRLRVLSDDNMRRITSRSNVGINLDDPNLSQGFRVWVDNGDFVCNEGIPMLHLSSLRSTGQASLMPVIWLQCHRYKVRWAILFNTRVAIVYFLARTHELHTSPIIERTSINQGELNLALAMFGVAATTDLPGSVPQTIDFLDIQPAPSAQSGNPPLSSFPGRVPSGSHEADMQMDISPSGQTDATHIPPAIFRPGGLTVHDDSADTHLGTMDIMVGQPVPDAVNAFHGLLVESPDCSSNKERYTIRWNPQLWRSEQETQNLSLDSDARAVPQTPRRRAGVSATVNEVSPESSSGSSMTLVNPSTVRSSSPTLVESGRSFSFNPPIPVVIKFYSSDNQIDTNDEKRSTIAAFLNEAQIYKALRQCPNVAPRCFGLFTTTDQRDGTVFLLVTRDAGQSVAPTWSDLHDLDRLPIIDLYHKLHGQGILHGDLSPQHIRRSTNGQLTIIDFGNSTQRALPADLSQEALALKHEMRWFS